MQYPTKFTINGIEISQNSHPYFIADIAANHDGHLDRAIELIHLAAEAGAHAAKFQHFSADTLVSRRGFEDLGQKASHQATWEKSVFEVYEDASLDLAWTEELAKACRNAGVAFMSTPYSIDLANHIDSHVEAYKIGSGDINYLDIIRHVSASGKPWFIATGAAAMEEVERAVQATTGNPNGVLMQCNTNYTGTLENFKYVNLNVLKTYEARFPNLILGLSDHTPGHSTVLGAIALGARVFEKHFTDDTTRTGPDHGFSMTPASWREMVSRSNEVFSALGGVEKKVEENERETVVLQRRSLRAKRDLAAGTQITSEMIVALRPAPAGSLEPEHLKKLVGKVLVEDLTEGAEFTWNSVTSP